VHNPFIEHEDSGEMSDEQLVVRGQQGDRQALEQLVLRHQPWIYNLVVRMVWATEEAQDLTQDILIKMITGLPGFRRESRFRTWLYRIVVNHIFTHQKQRADEPVVTYAEFIRDLDETPDLDLPDPHDPATQLLIEEAKILCTIAMLLCLDGRQRLVFTLGEVFGVTDRVGAEVLDMTPANFRQLLARARRDLYNFMAGKCGLVNESNPCRCARKTRGFIQQGYMSADHLRFAEGHRFRVREVAPSRAHELEVADERLHADLFREHPFLDIRGQSALVQRVLGSVNLEPPQ
jgi:RNA polymerase sigma factor (sigma-70 family)